MKNLNELYGTNRAQREIDRKNLEIKYKEGLLYLLNEEVDEWLEICNKIHNGEINYDFKRATMNLGTVVRQRDELADEIKSMKGENEEAGREFIEV